FERHGSTPIAEIPADLPVGQPPSAASSLPPELTSCALVADRVAQDADSLQVAAIYAGRADFPLAKLVTELVSSASVPFLPILCSNPSGLVKRQVWERTWALQRREDAGEDGSPPSWTGGRRP